MYVTVFHVYEIMLSQVISQLLHKVSIDPKLKSFLDYYDYLGRRERTLKSNEHTFSQSFSGNDTNVAGQLNIRSSISTNCDENETK